jgi:hypothetical protein
MNRQQFEQLIKEELKAVLNESKLVAGDNSFNIDVSVNKNPTKEGIKIQLKPSPTTTMDSDEKSKVTTAVQEKLNNSLEPLGLQVNEDPDIRQATDDPNVLGFYIPLDQIKQMIVDAIKGN